MLGILFWSLVALLCWACAWTEWEVRHGASVVLAVLGSVVFVLRFVPLARPS